MEHNIRTAKTGLNLDSSSLDVKEGQFTYMLNGLIENFDGQVLEAQNETGNDLCATFPEGYKVVGVKAIDTLSRTLYLLANPITNDSQIGYVEYNSCEYITLVGDEGQDCKIGFSVESPIHKIVVKTTNCSTQAYWAQPNAPRRYLDFDDLPWKEEIDPSNDYKRIKLVGQLDCNKLNVQPDFAIPTIDVKDIVVGGELITGTYQFAVQYSNELGEGYTSYYNVTNPVGIFEDKGSGDFNLPTSKAINISIQNLDTTGFFEHFNIAVVKTINGISTSELVGTFAIASATKDPVSKIASFNYTYTGTSNDAIQLDTAEIFVQFPYYDIANDLTSTDNVLLWADLKSDDEVNYQQIWSNVKLYWETYKVPYSQFEGYFNGVNMADLRGYMRDEVYPFEGQFLLKNGKKVKAFHIPARTATSFDRELIPASNKDNIILDDPCADPEVKQRWQVYNTGSVIDKTKQYKDFLAANPPTVVTTPNFGQTIIGNVDIDCDNNGAGTSQGCAALTITFTSPTPTGGITLQIAHIDSAGGAMGWDIGYTPTGKTSNYYGSQPFTINIPGGVTTFSVPKCTVSNGRSNWVCLPTLNNISTIYFKVLCNTAKFTVSSFQTSSIAVHNISDTCSTNTVTISKDRCYKGPYEYGEFAYWESIEKYPNNQTIWGSLANTPIRHHKFPDVAISPIHTQNESEDIGIDYKEEEYFIFPIGVRIDTDSLYDAIKNSNLTQEQKDQIVGFKIVRGNRAENKSIIAKGMMHNVGKSTYDNKDYYYANYPYNDLRVDPYFNTLKLYRGNVLPIDQGFQSALLGGSTPLELGYGNSYNNPYKLNGFQGDADRFTFHSPDTHFFQPSLTNEGSYLKLEAISYGRSYGHFVKVEDNAEYKFLTRDVLIASAGAALGSGLTIGAGSFGSPTFTIANAAATYTAFNDIFEKITPFDNFGYTYHSFGVYGNYYPIPNEGNKQRYIDYNSYATDGANRIEDGETLNNYRRESAVYIHTTEPLLYPTEYDSQVIPEDKSRYNLKSIGDGLAPEAIRETDISSYYGAIKLIVPSQWGRMYSYESIDTGYYQELYDEQGNKLDQDTISAVFGGDIYINRFAYKSKLPLFRRNTVGAANGTDIDYSDIGNINYPAFWLSTKPVDFNIDVTDEVDKIIAEIEDANIWKILGNVASGGARAVKVVNDLIVALLKEIYNRLGIKNVNLDRWELEDGQSSGINERGLMYLFLYGIPYYFCESEVNVDYRQAYNDLEGNFYPRVSNDIPDDWLQETNVPIINDNTYTYNKTYSKQNKESFISHLAETFDPEKRCFTEFPNRVIWSDKSNVEETKNNWLVYRPASRFDLPRSYGDFTAIDSLTNRQLLVRFTNKSQIYNALTTVDVSQGPAAVLGNANLFAAQPIDLSETDIGYAGSQHKLLLKTEFGNVFIDAKRGQVILFDGQVRDLTDQAVSKWFAQNLPFKILEYAEDFPIDNNFNGIGLHGVYDAFYQRFIITKIDYTPKEAVQVFSTGEAYYNDQQEQISRQVEVGDLEYFNDESWTISYCFKTNSWISYHSYKPNYYIGYSTYFQSGLNKPVTVVVGDDATLVGSSLWNHNKTFTKFNNFYGQIEPYVIEYPFVYKTRDEILQSVKDYSSVRKYNSFDEWYEPDETLFFNKAIVKNSQQCTGVLNLIPKEQNNLQMYMSYPKFNIDSKDILVTKSDNFYNYNMLWDIVADKSKPIFIGFDINQDNMDYTNRPRKYYPLRAKDTRVRHILDDRDDLKIISKFIITETTPSYK